MWVYICSIWYYSHLIYLWCVRLLEDIAVLVNAALKVLKATDACSTISWHFLKPTITKKLFFKIVHQSYFIFKNSMDVPSDLKLQYEIASILWNQSTVCCRLTYHVAWWVSIMLKVIKVSILCHNYYQYYLVTIFSKLFTFFCDKIIYLAYIQMNGPKHSWNFTLSFLSLLLLVVFSCTIVLSCIVL